MRPFRVREEFRAFRVCLLMYTSRAPCTSTGTNLILPSYRLSPNRFSEFRRHPRRARHVRYWDDPPSLLPVKLLPSYRVRDPEVERSIAYVGMARARVRLGLSYAAERYGGTTSGPAGPWLSSLRILTWAMKASMLPSSHASESSPLHEVHPCPTLCRSDRRHACEGTSAR